MRNGTKLRIWLFSFCCVVSTIDEPILAQESASQNSATKATTDEAIVLIVGAAGTDEYQEAFAQWAQSWERLAANRNWQMTRIENAKAEKTPRAQLQETLSQPQPTKRLWIVMLGHGTYERGTAKFNLNGPDVSAKDLKSWLPDTPTQTIVLSCFSSSAPFLSELASPKRILISATKSGSEYNFSRFGEYLAHAIQNLENDIDHDKEVSLLEAFLAASKGTERFYEQEARLASEHALLDDNGDKVGTSSEFYRGLRPVKEGKQGNLDGAAASRVILMSSPDSIQLSESQVARRAELERALDELRNRKAELEESSYFEQLESLLLELASVYDAAEKSEDSH